MGLDIRIPIGLMFALIGVLLAGFGAVSDKAIYARSLGLNVNLWWGLALLVFGLVMLGLSRMGGPTSRPTSESAEGEATEAREHRLGLEHEEPREH